MNRTIDIISFTDGGRVLSLKLKDAFAALGYEAEAVSGKASSQSVGENGSGAVRTVRLSDWTAEHFRTGAVLIFIGATGIAVRAIAPHVKDKKTDAAVIVMDEKGRFAVPVLSGHIGEANLFAGMAAAITGGQTVLTTATDVNRLFAVDVLANRNELVISDMTKAKLFSAALLESRAARIMIPDRFADLIRVEGEVPEEAAVVRTEYDREADVRAADNRAEDVPRLADARADGPRLTDVVISPGTVDPAGPLQLVPRCLYLGVGCRRGKDAGDLLQFLKDEMAKAGLSPAAVRSLNSIDLKKDEAGLITCAKELGVPFRTFPAEILRAAEGDFTPSSFVAETTGVDNVCERAAWAAATEEGGGPGRRFILRKTARDGMTLAVVMAEVPVRF